MAVIRWVLGRIILLLNWVFTPRGIKRTPVEQKLVDEKTKDLVLYQYEACPFCVKVRRELKRKTMTVELRDAKRNEQYKKELQENGGRLQVPCLKLTENGQDRWLYESGEIISFLQQRVA